MSKRPRDSPTEPISKRPRNVEYKEFKYPSIFLEDDYLDSPLATSQDWKSELCPGQLKAENLPQDPILYDEIPLDRLVRIRLSNGLLTCYDIDALKEIIVREKEYLQKSEFIDPILRVPWTPELVNRIVSSNRGTFTREKKDALLAKLTADRLEQIRHQELQERDSEEELKFPEFLNPNIFLSRHQDDLVDEKKHPFFIQELEEYIESIQAFAQEANTTEGVSQRWRQVEKNFTTLWLYLVQYFPQVDGTNPLSKIIDHDEDIFQRIANILTNEDSTIEKKNNAKLLFRILESEAKNIATASYHSIYAWIHEIFSFYKLENNDALFELLDYDLYKHLSKWMNENDEGEDLHKDLFNSLKGIIQENGQDTKKFDILSLWGWMFRRSEKKVLNDSLNENVF